MTELLTPEATRVLDVRPVAPKHRFETIMHAFDTLPPWVALELVVDHDPQCMYYTLLAEQGADAFTFEYLENGPETWRIHVTRPASD